MSFRHDERGSVGIMFGLTTVAACGMISLAIDVGHAYSVRSKLQFALDGAVMSALDQAANAQEAYAKNFLAVNAPAINAVSTFTPSSDGKYFGTATASVPTTLVSLIGVKTLTVRVKAAAALTTIATEDTDTAGGSGAIGGIPCIHVMDQSNLDAFYIESNSNVDASDCEAHVRSNRNTAMRAVSSSNVKFKKIMVKGTSAEVSGDLTIMDAPHTITDNADVTGNPYSEAVQSVTRSLSAGACTASNTGKVYKDTTINPGTYCGATTFENVKMNPGLYIIASGTGNKKGALTVLNRINGNGVSIYLADNQSKLVRFQPGQDSILKAPTTGATKGLLIFEASNRGSTWSLNANSISKQVWQGVIYLPSINLTLDSLSDSEPAAGSVSGQPYTLNVSMAVNQLTLKSVSKSKITPFAWIPLNSTSVVTYDTGTTTTTTTSTPTRKVAVTQ